MAARILVLAGVVALLWATGLLELDLPWNDPIFQVTGATVLVYLVWSLLEGGRRRPGIDAAQLGIYVVLLVSAADSFLFDLTVFDSPMALRWAGAVIMAAGCAVRLASVYRVPRTHSLRAGRGLQLLGLPLGLGSIAGLVLGLLPAMVAALRTDESGSFSSAMDEEER